MTWGIFDVQHKRRYDGTAYSREVLLSGITFQSEDKARDMLRHLNLHRLYNWRELKVREVQPKDLETTIQAVVYRK